MDAVNRFHTRTTYALVRSDHMILGAFIALLLAIHMREVNWLRFAIAFSWIDLVGYLPGALYYRSRARGGAEGVPRIFVALYNSAHNVALNLGLIIIWFATTRELEWAMLAAPLHLCIDRGVFGNIYKTFKLSFEPIAHPGFSELDEHLEGGGDWPGTAPSSAESARDLQAIDALVERHADHPSIGLVYNRDTLHFTLPDGEGFIAYRKHGKTLFCIGGPVCVPERRDALLREFLRFAAEYKCAVVGLQVREHDVELYNNHGFRINQMGCSYTLGLGDFKLAGGRFMKLRNKIKQPARAGVAIREVQERRLTPELRAQLDGVTHAWLKSKGGHVKELQFLVGEIEAIDRAGARCFAAYRGDEMIAFITYVPSHGRFSGLMHDLTRRKPDCPAGTLEAINHHAIETFKAEGIQYLCFGFTPLVGVEDHHPSHSPFITKLFHFLEKHGALIYPATDQANYKRKWFPEHIEPEFLAFQAKFSLGQLWSFLRLTRSI